MRCILSLGQGLRADVPKQNGGPEGFDVGDQVTPSFEIIVRVGRKRTSLIGCRVVRHRGLYEVDSGREYVNVLEQAFADSCE